MDAVNVDKLAELFRAYRRTDEVAEAAKGVVERALRYQDTHTQADRRTRILPVKVKANWLRSTLEWLTKTTTCSYGVAISRAAVHDNKGRNTKHVQVNSPPNGEGQATTP